MACIGSCPLVSSEWHITWPLLIGHSPIERGVALADIGWTVSNSLMSGQISVISRSHINWGLIKRLLVNFIFNWLIYAFANILGHSICKLLNRFYTKVLLVVMSFVAGILCVIIWNSFENLFNLFFLNRASRLCRKWCMFTTTFWVIAIFKFIWQYHVMLCLVKLIMRWFLCKLKVAFHIIKVARWLSRADNHWIIVTHLRWWVVADFNRSNQV